MSTEIDRPHPLRWLALGGIALYLIALFSNALKLADAGHDIPGWFLLLFGWMGLFAVLDGDFSAVGWMANPCFVLGTFALLTGFRKAAAGFAIAALVFLPASFLLNEVMINEGGMTSKVIRHDYGFWIWMTAIVFNSIVTFVVALISGIRVPAELNPVHVEPTEIPPDKFI